MWKVDKSIDIVIFQHVDHLFDSSVRWCDNANIAAAPVFTIIEDKKSKLIQIQINFNNEIVLNL